MFRDFAKRKFDDYLAMLEFPAGRISFSNLRTSSLPPFIITFFEYYLTEKTTPVNKKDFEEILNKAIVFNINYIIKPKNTIMKFLFGEVETRPVNFINERLKYFQFYGYYISQITDFINVNSLEIVSSEHAEHLIDQVNKKIFEEISAPGNDAHRMNLIKLLYYFFHDLSDNNPINIKLPKKILSAFFRDKGFHDIRKRVDGFFSDEIFIQEALELMNPETKKSERKKSEVDVSDEEIKDILSKAKTGLINKESSDIEVEKILKAEEAVPGEPGEINIMLIREQESKLPEIEKSRLVIDDEIYSDDLIFASHFNSMAPAAVTDAAVTDAAITDAAVEDPKTKIIDELFCEVSYRKKIIKSIFSRDENKFMDTLNGLLSKQSWQEASALIEELFNKERVNYFSEEAVKFVDILQSYFAKESFQPGKSRAS